MKLALLSLLFCLTSVAFAQDTIPIVRPSAWFKADSLVVDSTVWLDVSGKGHQMVPALGNALPGMDYLNFNPCFVVNALTGPMRVTYNFNDKQRLTVVSVYGVSDTVNEQGIWTAHKGLNRPLALSTLRFVGEHHSLQYMDTAFVEPVVSTMTASWMKIPGDTTTQDTIFLGRNDSLGFNGKIAEYMVFNEFVSAKDLQAYRSYLCLKYGVTLQKMDYLDPFRNIIWDTAVAYIYRFGIAGLGRDTVMGLHQKQSTSQSMNDILTISAGTLHTTNSINTFVISPGDYLIWGNNGGNITQFPIDSSNFIKVLGRTWLLQASGTTPSGIATSLVFNIGSMNLDSARIRLIVDHAADTGINFLNVEYIQPDSISQGKIYFSGVFWDIDGNHREMFSLLFDRSPLSMAYHPPTSNLTNQTNGNPINEPYYPYTSQPYYTPILGVTNTIPAAQSLSGSLNAWPNNSGDDVYTVYPNPTSGQFTLKINLREQSSVEVKVIDLKAELIQQYEMTGDCNYTLKGEILVSGAYYLDIACRNQHKYLKLIVR